MMFLSTACHYLSGQSGLPSILPSRGSVDLAKEKSRKVRLFCKGLEQFCEILYKEPVDEQIASNAVPLDQSSPESMSAVTTAEADQGPIASAATKDDEDPAGSIGSVTGSIADQKLMAPTTRDSTSAVTAAMADQGPRHEVPVKGELTFQSLFEENKTPPGSPGSTISSSTLVNPQSRKVSPIIVKDFAYPNSDSNDVLEPVAMIDENTKKELLKQLQKKLATEEKVPREVKKLTARNKTLSAELESFKAIVQNRDMRAELANVHANAMTLSNVVLRKALQDLSHTLSHEKNSAQMQGNQTQGETIWNQEKEVSVQGDLRPVEDFDASAYGRIARLENASAERAPSLDDLQDQGILQQENESPIGEAVNSKESGSIPVEAFGRQASDKTRILGKFDSDPAALPGIFHSPSPTIQNYSAKDKEENSHTFHTPDEVEQHQFNSVASETDLAISQDNQQRSLETDKSSSKDKNAEEGEPGEDLASQKSTMDVITSHNCIQGVGSYGINGEFEFSEAAGPATLWGILGSDVSDLEVPALETGKAPSMDITTDLTSLQTVGSGGIGGEFGFSEAAGPATLWGILGSDVSDVEVPGPATLRELFESDESEDEFQEGAYPSEEAAGFTEAEVSGSEDEVEVNGLSQDDNSPAFQDGVNGRYDVSDDEEHFVVGTVAPTNTPAGGEGRTHNPHGSVDGDVVAVQEDDAHEAVDGVAETANDHESVSLVHANPPIGATEGVNACASAATFAHMEAREEEQTAREDSASHVPAKSGQLEGGREKEESAFAEDDAITQAHPLSAAEEQEDLEEGKPLEVPAVSGTLQVSCEDHVKKDDHELRKAATEGCSIIAAEETDNSGVVHAQSPSPSCIPASPPRGSAPPQAEKLDAISSVPKPSVINKTQKRRDERKRADKKKKEEAAMKRRMEEEAAKTPEAFA